MGEPFVLFLDFLLPAQETIKITCPIESNLSIQQLKHFLEEEFHKLFPRRERIKINSVYALKEFLVPVEYESRIHVKDLFPAQSIITLSCEWKYTHSEQEKASSTTTFPKQNSASSQQIIVEDEIETEEPPQKKQRIEEEVDSHLQKLNEAKALVQDKISQKKNLTKEERIYLRGIYETLPEEYRHELKALFSKNQ